MFHATSPFPSRTGVKGNVLRELDESALPELVSQLERERIESVAIGLLHSYANPDHERRVGDLIARTMPSMHVTLSSEVCPEVREYERLTTTVCNAYVQPIMARYLSALAIALKEFSIGCPLLLITSGGSICSLETAIRFPIRLVESGPSGGAVLASSAAARRGEQRVVSYDMGGTTAKICLIDDATPQTSRTFEIARAARFMRGSGMTIRLPVIDMIEIGAGGGSIARVNDLGQITVGPESAGSEPGPSCYQRGGTDATVTDADLLLGRLDDSGFATNQIELSTFAATASIRKGVANPAELRVIDGARAISEVVDETMANAAKVHAVERGMDLRQRTMIAFGGAGPVHACRVAAKSGISRIIIPEDPGVGSAIGFLLAPTAYEIVQSLYMTLEDFDSERITGLFEDLEQQARAVVRSGAPDAKPAVHRSCFMRYVGQGHEIEIPVSNGKLDKSERDTLLRAYETEYTRQFNRKIPGMGAEVLSWKLVVSAPHEIQPFDGALKVEAHQSRPHGSRSIVDARQGQITVPVHERTRMAPGATFAGPCLVIEAQTTTVVTADFDGYIDALSNIVLERKED